MRAGTLRHRLEIQAPSDEDVGDTGNPDTTYAVQGVVWGRIEPLSVTERLRAEQVAATATHLVTIRHFPQLTQKSRFRFGQREFAIESIIAPESRPIEMRVMVREETP